MSFLCDWPKSFAVWVHGVPSKVVFDHMLALATVCFFLNKVIHLPILRHSSGFLFKYVWEEDA